MMYGIIMVLMQPMADLSGLIPPIMMRTRRGDEWADAAVDDGMGMADAEDEDDDDNDGDDSGDGGGHGSSEAVPDGGMSFALSRSRILPLNTSRPLA